ncbi:phage tail assembly protein [Maridesulfovibrio ferrireducens]|uniref:phage tail assembly protein n=1 Tax=Maridesulfovibrio ferrireducens TaxID=246191 RepID=UPI001A263F8C|nr:phage tail assembly protein [Maridesulfovibrio ferrireducens]MBI9110122.1 phage tail assembly protein [Maridesulfovibrio ferrireducens]
MATITLEYPVEENGLKIDKLEMRRPKVRDQISAKKTSNADEDVEVKLFANLCEVSPAVIEDMDMKDYKTLQKEYKSFLS